MSNEEPKEQRRISLSVDILDERLRNWSAEVRRDQQRVLDALKQMGDRYDAQIGGLELWRVEYGIKQEQLRLDADRLRVDLTALQEEMKKNKTVYEARVSLLKAQWTWAIAGVIGASAVLGFASQLGFSLFPL